MVKIWNDTFYIFTAKIVTPFKRLVENLKAEICLLSFRKNIRSQISQERKCEKYWKKDVLFCRFDFSMPQK